MRVRVRGQHLQRRMKPSPWLQSCRRSNKHTRADPPQNCAEKSAPVSWWVLISTQSVWCAPIITGASSKSEWNLFCGQSPACPSLVQYRAIQILVSDRRQDRAQCLRYDLKKVVCDPVLDLPEKKENQDTRQKIRNAKSCNPHSSSVRVGFCWTDFFADFSFWAARLFRGFCRWIFSPHFCGKKCPEKSSRKIPGKILQHLYDKNPRHISAEGPGQHLPFSKLWWNQEGSGDRILRSYLKKRVPRWRFGSDVFDFLVCLKRGSWVCRRRCLTTGRNSEVLEPLEPTFVLLSPRSPSVLFTRLQGFCARGR